MPKAKSKKAAAPKVKKARRLYVVLTDDCNYEIFTTKPRLVSVTQKLDQYGYITRWAGTYWKGKKNSDEVHSMCDTGFEGATGLKLPEGVVAKLTLTVSY